MPPCVWVAEVRSVIEELMIDHVMSNMKNILTTQQPCRQMTMSTQSIHNITDNWDQHAYICILALAPKLEFE